MLSSSIFFLGESMMLFVAQLSAVFRRRQTPDLEPNRKRILSRTIEEEEEEAAIY